MRATALFGAKYFSSRTPCSAPSTDLPHVCFVSYVFCIFEHGFAGKLVGNALLAAAFVSYAGPFNMSYRRALVADKWLPDLLGRAIPLTPGVMPLDVLTTDATKVACAIAAVTACSARNATVDMQGAHHNFMQHLVWFR